MDALVKQFEKMAINDVDEELGAASMEIEEDEVLRRQFDCLEDDSDDSEWEPVERDKKSVKVPGELDFIKRKLRSSRICDVHPQAGDYCHTGVMGWDNTYSLMPNASLQFSESKEDELAAEGSTSKKGAPDHKQTINGDGSVEVQLESCGLEPSNGKSPRFKSNSTTERKKNKENGTRHSQRNKATPGQNGLQRHHHGSEEKLATSLETHSSNDYGTVKKNYIDIEDRNAATEVMLNRSETDHDEKLRSPRSAQARPCCRGSCANAPVDAEAYAPSSSPFPTRSSRSSELDDPKTNPAQETKPAPAPAPSPSPIEPSSTNLNNSSKYNTQRMLHRSQSPGRGLGDLTPMVQGIIDRELRRQVDEKAATSTSCATERQSARVGNKPPSYQLKTQSSRPTPLTPGTGITNGFPRPKAKEKETVAVSSKLAEKENKPEASIASTDRNRDGKQAAASGSYSSVRRPITEVCILLDSSNASMEKFLTPIRLNLARFWDMAFSSHDTTMRVGMLTTASTKLDFTSNQKDFLTFCQEIEGESRTHLPSIVDGSIGATAQLNGLNWTGGSRRYVYIFTNLSGCDPDDEYLKWKLSERLMDLSRHLPMGAETLIGTWMDDNVLLQGALLAQKEVDFRTFSLLDLKRQVSFVVKDQQLVDALIHSLSTERIKTHVRISQKEHAAAPSSKDNPSGRCWTSHVLTNVLIFQPKALDTIEAVLSEGEPTFNCTACWVKRQSGVHHLNHDEVLSLGKLGLQSGEWKEDVMIKTLKLDEKNGRKGATSERHHRNRAYVASVAKFFAKQYNKHHRPENCAKIRFLNGYVVEQNGKEGEERERLFYYAEQLVTTSQGVPNFIQFCDATGQWNEIKVDESLLRFALTCFKLSGGDLMLSGLKGIRRDGAFILAAPVLLSRTDGDAHVNECTKEYMTLFRKSTQELMKKKGWNSKKSTANSESEAKSYLSVLLG